MMREVGAAAGWQKVGARAPEQPRERGGDAAEEAASEAVSRAASRRSQTNIAAAAPAEHTRIGSGRMASPIESARYAEVIAVARNASADAATASAPMSGIAKELIIAAER